MGTTLMVPTMAGRDRTSVGVGCEVDENRPDGRTALTSCRSDRCGRGSLFIVDRLHHVGPGPGLGWHGWGVWWGDAR